MYSCYIILQNYFQISVKFEWNNRASLMFTLPHSVCMLLLLLLLLLILLLLLMLLNLLLLLLLNLLLLLLNLLLLLFLKQLYCRWSPLQCDCSHLLGLLRLLWLMPNLCSAQLDHWLGSHLTLHLTSTWHLHKKLSLRCHWRRYCSRGSSHLATLRTFKTSHSSNSLLLLLPYGNLLVLLFKLMNLLRS